MEPIIFGSQTPMLLEYFQAFGPFIAVGLTALITWKLALRRIEAEFDIKREETRLFKERVFIEKKIGLLNDVEALLDNFDTELASNIKGIRAKLTSVRERVDSYVITDGLVDIAQRGVDEAVKLDAQIDEIIRIGKKKKKKEIDSLSGIIKSKLANPAAALRIALILLQQHLSFDLGFRPIRASGNSEDIDIFADDLKKRALNIEENL